jgi:small subunit ribosomal protein S17
MAKAPAAKTEKKTTTAASTQATEGRKREMVGTVVSDKMQKTIVVKIDRRTRDGMYEKFVTKSRRFKAHDEKNDAKVGDLVIIKESRPLSADKRWALKEIVRRANRDVLNG